MRSWPTRAARRARIEIIPMIDVMMFLLVFFVLISVNVLPALGLKITPPSSGAPDKIIEKIRVTIGLDRDGRTFVDGVETALSEVPAKIRNAAGEKPVAVIISGDEASAIQSLIGVMDALRSAGVPSMQIVARQK